MESGKSLMAILSVFMFVLIGLYLLPSVAQEQNAMTETSAVVNETVAIATQAGTTTNDDLTANPTYFGNSSNDYTSLIGTGVNITLSSGAIVTSAAISDGDYHISYGYYPDNYIDSGATRQILKLVILFFAIGVMAIGMMAFTKSDMFKGFRK